MKEQSAERVIICPDLAVEIDLHIARGYRLDMIFPADAPREAVLSRDGESIRLESQEKRAADGEWHVGRAGMEYRDLIPDRLGGRLIASHIRIQHGGPIPDYVHYHKIDFQMIYCLKGSARLVYEDQGGPFDFRAGDCVLQPPEIRHRVLECSDGFEVLEIGTPAEHPTFVEHEFDLPNSSVDRDRIFGGQRFLHYRRSTAVWKPVGAFERSTPDVAAATAGFADFEVWRASGPGECRIPDDRDFLFVADGSLEFQLDGAERRVERGQCFVMPVRQTVWVRTRTGVEVILVRIDSIRSSANDAFRTG